MSRFGEFWVRHRRILWALHSVWALATGVVVILLARERYGFVPWVVLMLGVTWVSTVFVAGRSASSQGTGEGPESVAADRFPGLGPEVASYMTRTLYQETLFFLLPFYAYSTVFWSWNAAFLALLAGLAVLACLDLVFDRWLRTRPLFGFFFFSVVAFAAVNLLLPILLGVRPWLATPIAALVAVVSSAPLALRDVRGRRPLLGITAGATAVVVILVAAPALVPPVPLRLDEAVFATGIDEGSLELTGSLDGPVVAQDVGPRLVVRARVFAPAAIPETVVFEWRRDGDPVRTSREVSIVAHADGFRVWDAFGDGRAAIVPGLYTVRLRTGGGGIFGRADLSIR